MTERDGECETRAIEHTGGHCHLKLLRPELEATALASTTRLGPGFATTTTVDACAGDRDVQRDDCTVMRLAARELNRRPQRRATLVKQKRAPHTIDGGCHRRKIDNDLIRKATGFQTAAHADADIHRSRTERTKDPTRHEQS